MDVWEAFKAGQHDVASEQEGGFPLCLCGPKLPVRMGVVCL